MLCTLCIVCILQTYTTSTMHSYYNTCTLLVCILASSTMHIMYGLVCFVCLFVNRPPGSHPLNPDAPGFSGYVVHLGQVGGMP